MKTAYDLLKPLAPFYAAKARLEDDSIYYKFTPRRPYWAEIDSYTYKIILQEIKEDSWGRYYAAVTTNGARGSKPNTFEFRICESSPLSCYLAVALTYYAYKTSIDTTKYRDFNVYWGGHVKVELLEELYYSTYDSLRPKPPRWFDRAFKAFLKGGKPYQVFNVLKYNIVEIDDIVPAIEYLVSYDHCNEFKPVTVNPSLTLGICEGVIVYPYDRPRTTAKMNMKKVKEAVEFIKHRFQIHK